MSADKADSEPHDTLVEGNGEDTIDGTVEASAGRPFGRYEIEAQLGAGGMGAVYRARDPILGRTVALKLLSSGDPRMLERFKQEAQLQARVDHVNICKVYEVGDVAGRPYIAMQLIHGRTLATAHAEMTIEQKVRIVATVADAIQAAHRQGLIHRDLKPANIIVERSEAGYYTPYVTDFGLARDLAGPGLTTSGQTVGTPAYMAPEQAYGEREAMDARTDVYGLGAVLYHIVADQPPFTGPTELDVMMKVVNEEPPSLRSLRPGISQDLETIILKCLEKESVSRYDSARALADDLRRYLDSEPILARRSGLASRIRRRISKHKRLAAVFAVLLTALIVLGAVALEARLSARQQARIAEQFAAEVARIDSIMNRAYVLPLHDIRPHREQVRLSIGRIEEQMRHLGRRAEGPGQFALGRGEVALGNYEEARLHFEKAREAGLNTDDLNACTGFVLSMLYTQQLDLLTKADGPDLRLAMRRKIEAELLEPARNALRDARDSALFPSPYVEGLLALCEKRYDDGLAGCDQVLERDRWFYDAWLLRGEILLDRADERRDGGDAAQAEAGYVAAEEAFRQAAAIGESDPRTYQGLVRVATARMQMGAEQSGGEMSAHMHDALKACEAAIAADPSRAESHLLRSAIYWRHGQDLLRRGDVPSATLQQAAAAAAEAIRLRPEDPAAHYSLAVPRLFEAQYRASIGQDPSALLRGSIEECRAAIRLDRKFYRAFSLLGVALQDRAEHEGEQGVDPMGSLREAVEVLEKAVAIMPDSAVPRLNLGNAHLNLAEAAREGGADPTSSLDRGIASYEKALSLNPGMTIAANNMAIAFEERALFEQSAGKDPTRSFEAAVGELHEMIESRPELIVPRVNLVRVQRELGEHLLRAGKDPTEALEHAIDDADQAIGLAPREVTVRVEKAAVLVVRAEYALTRSRSPLADLAAADELLLSALRIDPPLREAERWRGVAGTIAARWRSMKRAE